MRAGGNGRDQHLETRKNCDLPKIPQPLYGEGPHTAPGATAVLIGAASAGERENAQAGWSPFWVGRKSQISHIVLARFQCKHYYKEKLGR